MPLLSSDRCETFGRTDGPFDTLFWYNNYCHILQSLSWSHKKLVLQWCILLHIAGCFNEQKLCLWPKISVLWPQWYSPIVINVINIFNIYLSTHERCAADNQRYVGCVFPNKSLWWQWQWGGYDAAEENILIMDTIHCISSFKLIHN